jgi:transposase
VCRFCSFRIPVGARISYDLGVLDVTKSLPEDPAELRAFTALLLAEVKSLAVLIGKLRHQLAGHRAHRFGASSETAEQLKLALEMSEIAIATLTAKLSLPDDAPLEKPKRQPIPDHIPRVEVELTIGDTVCAQCGGKLRRQTAAVGRGCARGVGIRAGKVHREPHRAPKAGLFRLRLLHSSSAADATDRARQARTGITGPCVGQQIRRSPSALPPSQIFDPEGLDIDCSTLGDWIGKSTALLEPLTDAIVRYVLAGQAIFVDDTPVAMLAPGTGKTQTARLRVYGRDER